LDALTNRRGRLTWVECVVASDICFHPSLMSFEFPRYGLPPRWRQMPVLNPTNHSSSLFFPLSFLSSHLDFHVKYSWKIKMGFQTSSSSFFYQIWLSFFWLLFLPIIFFLSIPSFNIWFVRKLDSLIFYAPSIW